MTQFAITLLQGVNLNRLGTRQTEIYGTTTASQLLADLQQSAAALKLDLSAFQTNCEKEMVEAIHGAQDNQTDLILINAGAWTHTSLAIADALLGGSVPYIEIHLSNTKARESFRHHSYLAKGALGIIEGFGPQSYELALQAAASALQSGRLTR